MGQKVALFECAKSHHSDVQSRAIRACNLVDLGQKVALLECAKSHLADVQSRAIQACNLVDLGQKVALLECAKSHLADVQNRAIKLRDPNFKQFNNDYPIQINVSTEKVDNFSMKFSKPRVLLENLYPDWEEAQPALFKKFVSEFAFPEDTSKMGKFLDSAINYLKSRQKEKNKKIDLNLCLTASNLYFANLCFLTSKNNYFKVSTLIDTGATNSLIHISVVNDLNLPFEPIKLNLTTASGTDTDAIIGLTHLKFILHDKNRKPFEYCTTFVVTTRLNNLSAILGAEILIGENKELTVTNKFMKFSVNQIQCETNVHNEKGPNVSCKNIHNSPTKILCSKCLTNDCNLTLVYPSHVECKNIFLSRTGLSTGKNILETEIPDQENLKEIMTMSHSVKNCYDNEKLPDSAQFFDDHHEIKFEALEKRFDIKDADLSECPKDWKKNVKSLLNDFKDRFSEFKLDVEVTDLYCADLETVPGKKVIQRCRRLANHKFQFAMQAIKQLEKAGVIRESDSEWRSNVVMVPKPTEGGGIRSSTKADLMTGHQNKAELYRLCLDFRELNDVLMFPKQTQFTTLDQFLYKLKNKYVVSLDISSSFFMIPIREEDKHKTAFWVNDYSYEYNVLVMGLKSSPYHLKKFLNKVFNSDNYENFKKQLTPEEQNLLPPSFEEFLLSYFDDVFIFADTYEQLFAVLKLTLLVCRMAKIKFSIEKSSFFTQNIKVLGYAFNTKDTILQMDKLKASAILNMKKPASLYELHSRLSSFQYQSMFIPYLKHITFPLQLLLRKNEFRWTEIEELAWTILKNVSTANLRLTIPDPEDNLVLTTDASKIACCANLFREKNGNLELVATNSKFFGTNDLNKCSYVLESIALAYGFKIYASYILNCTGKICIFTDAKSLIYAKRNSTHSILLNSTLSYIANFVSMANIEIYHLPGNINRLADIMSRAISENLNCNLPKEHPISKQWAKVLPPLHENFAVSRDSLFKFLTEPLKPESQDIFDRTHRKLQESKSIQEQFNDSLKITPEHKYYCAVRLLEQFNDQYLNNHEIPQCQDAVVLHEAKIAYDQKRREALFNEINNILQKIYDNDTDSYIKRKCLQNLKEVAISYMKTKNKKLTFEESQKLDAEVENLLDFLEQSDQKRAQNKTDEKLKNYFIQSKSIENPTILFQLAPDAIFKPKIEPGSNGWDLPLQEDVILYPFECKKIDLKIKIILPKNHCAILINKSSARIKYNIHVTIGLIDNNFKGYIACVIQNLAEEKIIINAGIALSQLLIIESKIPKFIEKWEDTDETRGSFGSTGNNFEKVNSENMCEPKETEIKNATSLIDCPPGGQNCKTHEENLPEKNMHLDLTGQENSASCLHSQFKCINRIDHSNKISCPVDMIKLPPVCGVHNTMQNLQAGSHPPKKQEIQMSQLSPAILDSSINLKSTRLFDTPKDRAALVKIESEDKNKYLIENILNKLNPYEINLELFKITVAGNYEERIEEINTLLEFEKNLFPIQNDVLKLMPLIEKNDYGNIHINNTVLSVNFDETDTVAPLNDIDFRIEYFEKNKNSQDDCLNDELKIEQDEDIKFSNIPEPNKNDLNALLIAELNDNYKIPLSLMIMMQENDPEIADIKRQLIEKPGFLKTFILKNDIVCKKYIKKDQTSFFIGVFIPTKLLYPVLIYIHKYYGHSSITQTLKQFMSLYYHPRAPQAVKKLFEKCYICAKSRNAIEKKLTVGRERALNPRFPREAISADILYFKKSSRNFSYGLLIMDLHSMYISFYPLKSKTSFAIANAFRQYISHFTAPKYVYTDSDQSFRGEVETLFFQFNITHFTSFPHCQRQNSVEGQVRTFKNIYRGTLMESAIFRHSEWDILYPLIVCRINSLIGKYGISREDLQFGMTSLNNLPIITDAILYEPLEHELDEFCKKFKSRLGKFINRRKISKKYYNISKDKQFGMDEVIMYRKFDSDNMLEPIFDGPARIKNLHPKGATLRCLRTGEEFSVAYEHLRKIEIEEFLQMLPKNFDSDIIKTLSNTRYRKFSDSVGNTVSHENAEIGNQRFTRSGKTFNIALHHLNLKDCSQMSKITLQPKIQCCKKTPILIPLHETLGFSRNFPRKNSILKRKFFNPVIGTPIIKDRYRCEFTDHKLKEVEKYSEPFKKSEIINGRNCTVKAEFIPEALPLSDKKIRFSHVEIIFLD